MPPYIGMLQCEKKHAYRKEGRQRNRLRDTNRLQTKESRQKGGYAEIMNMQIKRNNRANKFDAQNG
jgi:hypothetical protein